MKRILITTIGIICCILNAVSAEKLVSHFQDTSEQCALQKNMVVDYGAKPDSPEDQSAIWQNAIEDLSACGGGKLIVPKGNYHIVEIRMCSNVHLVIEAGTVLTLSSLKRKNGNTAMFYFSGPTDDSFIENCSIRGDGGQYYVDFSFFDSGNASPVRFALLRRVRNFLIADAFIKDNFTKFCGISLTPMKSKNGNRLNTSEDSPSRPTCGEIRNCHIDNAHSGYGLCQLHGARDIFFHDISAKGGVTLRLETGAGGLYEGVYDIRAVNVRNCNGRAAVLMQPHCSSNGKVAVDSVYSNSSSFAVLIHAGFLDRHHKNNPDARPGVYASDSYINHVHAVYGDKAQVDCKEVYLAEERNYGKYKPSEFAPHESMTGPSLAAVYDTTDGSYRVTVNDVTSEGFSPTRSSILYLNEVRDKEDLRWKLYKSLPCVKATSCKQSNE